MGFQSFGVLALAFICLHIGSISGMPEDACFEKLSMETKQNLIAMLETCKKKVGIEELPKPEEVEKNGFDDKCFAKCKLQEMKVLTDKGTIDEAALGEIFKKVIPDKQADVINVWKACADTLMKTMEAEGGINEKNSCKAAAMLKHCFMKDVKKLC